MQLYRVPPDFEVSYTEFETSTAERLSILQTIDEVNSKGLKGDEWRKAVIEELKKQDMRGFCKQLTATSCGSAEADFAQRRRDHMSHFVLRLAFCDTEEKRRWFIAREVDLFKLRWMYLRVTEKAEFMKINKLAYDTVSHEEKIELSGYSDIVSPSIEYYKVPFASVSELVRARKVFLKKGYAFITNEDIVSVILTSYRMNLSRSLTFASHKIHLLDEDDRIFMVLKGAGRTRRSVDYEIVPGAEGIDIKNIDTLCEMSFPPCMQKIHHRLRTEHHLKHSARRQYALFLKGIGVAMEDTIAFWRQEFGKKMNPDKFDKEHGYLIRHTYGAAGKRFNYRPMDCLKVISQSVSPGECHGCPFRHDNQQVLKKMLQQNGLSVIGVQEVLDSAKNNHYQVACGKYFQLKHDSDSTVITHPNLYFDMSRDILKGKMPKKEEPGGKIFI
ncbi:hypothetical protein AAG570_001749 [Ranatra chinensis]|uniref:DNA primase large subunit n=1 Tax=Ranatra chinensis TaxID=642074 RepID=A0ABD0YBC7_9HEMI